MYMLVSATPWVRACTLRADDVVDARRGGKKTADYANGNVVHHPQLHVLRASGYQVAASFPTVCPNSSSQTIRQDELDGLVVAAL